MGTSDLVFCQVFVILVILLTCSRSNELRFCRELDKHFIPVTKQLYNAGVAYNLQCCFSGQRITWTKNGQPVSNVSSLKNRFYWKENNRVLIIDQLSQDDSGNYTCSVERKNLTNWTKTIILDVRQRPTVKFGFSVRLERIPRSVEGSNTTLVCYVTSPKRPRVFWYKINTTVKDQKDFRNDKRLLSEIPTKDSKGQENDLYVSRYRLINVTVEDSGVYRCLAMAYIPRRVIVHDNDTLLVIPKELPTPEDQDRGNSSRKELSTPEVQDGGDSLGEVEPTPAPSIQKSPAKSIIIGISLLVLILVLLAVIGIVVYFVRKQKKKTSNDFKKPDRESCPASIHNENSQDNRGDEKCICYEVYDVFISYNSKDGDFVRGELYDKLTGIYKYKVCVDVNAFVIGEFITNNITNSIWRSRKTLLVVSKNFFKSNWTDFEVAVAQARHSKGKNVLIMIVLEKLKQTQLPPKLRHYYKTRTYLEWYNKDVRANFWERLRAAIGPPLADSDDINAHNEVNSSADVTFGDDANLLVADESADSAMVKPVSDGVGAKFTRETNVDVSAKAKPHTDDNVEADADVDVDTDADSVVCVNVPLLGDTNYTAKYNVVSRIADLDCNGQADVK